MKTLKFITSGEFIFFLFIISGSFKAAIPSFPVDLTIFLMLWSIAIAVKRLYTEGNIASFSIKPVMLYLLFAVIILLSTFYSDSTVYGIQKSLKFITITAWSFIGGFLLLRSTESLNRFIKGILFSATILSVFSLYQYVVNYNPLLQYRFGIEGNPLALAQVSALGALVSLLFVMYRTTKMSLKLFYLGIAMMLVFTSIITGSRMPMISFGLATLLVLMLSVKISKRGIVIRKGLFTFILLMTISITIFLANSSSIFFQTFNYRINALFLGQGDESLQERLNRYSYAWEMFIENPFLGKGAGSFAVNYNSLDVRSYPHNIFFEIMAEFGILGLSLFCLLLLIGLISAFSVIKNNITTNQIIVLSIALFAFLNANVSSDINDNRMFFCFWGIVCMLPLYKEKKIEPVSNKNEKSKRAKRLRIVW